MWWNSSRICVLEVDPEYPKELHELNYDFPLAPGKSEINREMLPYCQSKTADGYITPTGNVMLKR